MAMMDLALVRQQQALQVAAKPGGWGKAKDLIQESGNFLDRAKPLLDQRAIASSISTGADGDHAVIRQYASRFEQQRLQCHQTAAGILVQLEDLDGTEREFRNAIESFPHVKGLWHGLSRVLDVQGKTDEAARAREMIQ